MMRDDSPMHALRKALAVTRTSTILDSVVEVNIGRNRNPFAGIPRSYKAPYLFTFALFTLVSAIPPMQHLHTIRLSSISLSRMYLYIILSSPYLIHLVLDYVQLPKMSIFPRPKLRKLTLTMMTCSWGSIRPLIAQLATSLEYLQLHMYMFLPSQLRLPPFPCLQELRYRQCYSWNNVSDKDQLNELLRLGSQVTHLHVTGHSNKPVTACRKSLQYLNTDFSMLSDVNFGTKPFRRLMHLSLDVYRSSDTANHLLIPSSFIHDHFPAITSLHLTITWRLRNCAMAMARSQHNVQVLKLIVGVIDYEESGEMDCCFPVEVPNDQLRKAKLPAALQTLTLEAIQYSGELERSATRCSRWVFDCVIPPVTGLGGTGLKSISLFVSQPKSSVERERVLSRQWVKTPNDGWQVLEY